MSRALKVVLSCLIGSGIGMFIALAVDSWFWWSGALAGALIGYLSYEFKKVVQAVPKAWRAVTDWKPDWEYWICVPTHFLFLTSLALSFLVFVGFLVFLGSYNPEALIWFLYLGDVSYLAIIGFAVIALVASFIVAGEIRTTNRELALYAVCFSPPAIALGLVALTVFFVGWIIWGSWRCKNKIPSAMKTLGRFFKKLFIIIHSEIRLLCAIDSLFGVVAGYIISQAYSLNLLAGVLVGMIAGVLLGLANYQIFSVWLLKLAPEKE